MTTHLQSDQPDSPGGYGDGYAVISRRRVGELVDMMDWYRRCLEDVQDRRVVRGLDEAKAGYEKAHDELLRYAGCRS